MSNKTFHSKQGRRSNTALDHARAWIRRSKRFMITNPNYWNEVMNPAFQAEDVSYTPVDDQLVFNEIEREKPPTYDELKARVAELEARIREAA